MLSYQIILLLASGGLLALLIGRLRRSASAGHCRSCGKRADVSTEAGDLCAGCYLREQARNS